jgi:hypothetical protein
MRAGAADRLWQLRSFCLFWRRYGPRSITLLLLCFALALLPVLIRRRLPRAHPGSPLLPVRSAGDGAHEKGVAFAVVPESPRRALAAHARSHSVAGVLSRQHLALDA